MTDLNTLWNNTKPSENQEYDLVPEGEYQAFVEKATLKEKDGKTTVSIQWRITGPEQVKRVLFANYDLTKEKGVARFKGDIVALGLTVLDFDALGSHLEYLVGKTATVNVTHSEWQGKTYVNTWLDRKSVATGAVKPEFDSNQEIPF